MFFRINKKKCFLCGNWGFCKMRKSLELIAIPALIIEQAVTEKIYWNIGIPELDRWASQ